MVKRAPPKYCNLSTVEFCSNNYADGNQLPYLKNVYLSLVT